MSLELFQAMQGLPYITDTSDAYYTPSKQSILTKNNCKNCGARYHVYECDYCGTPTSGDKPRTATQFKELYRQMVQANGVAYDKEYISALQAQQLSEGHMCQLTNIPPKRSIGALFGSLLGLI